MRKKSGKKCFMRYTKLTCVRVTLEINLACPDLEEGPKSRPFLIYQPTVIDQKTVEIKTNLKRLSQVAIISSQVLS